MQYLTPDTLLYRLCHRPAPFDSKRPLCFSLSLCILYSVQMLKKSTYPTLHNSPLFVFTPLYSYGRICWPHPHARPVQTFRTSLIYLHSPNQAVISRNDLRVLVASYHASPRHQNTTHQSRTNFTLDAPAPDTVLSRTKSRKALHEKRA